MTPLQIQTRQAGVAVVVSLVGPADMNNEAALERQVNRLTASRPAVVVLDLAGLTFLASMAVGQFVMLARSLKGWGGSVRVAAPSPQVRLVLERCRLGDTLPAFPSIEEALA